MLGNEKERDDQGECERKLQWGHYKEGEEEEKEETNETMEKVRQNGRDTF